MKEKTESIYQNCKLNLAMVKRRLKTIKETPNPLEYLFLPLTKKETLECYEIAMKKYEKEQARLEE